MDVKLGGFKAFERRNDGGKILYRTMNLVNTL